LTVPATREEHAALKKMSEAVDRRTFLSVLVRLLWSSLASSILLSRSNLHTELKSAYGYKPASDEKPRYEDILEIISNDRFNVCPIIEYDSSYREDKVNVLLRHDNDNGYGMAKLDNDAGIRSTFYLRLHATQYQLEDVAEFYQKLESVGYEIGYHCEVMDLCDTVTYNSCVRNLFTVELAPLRRCFNIRSVAPHGGEWNYLMDRSPVWPGLSQRCNVISAYHIPYQKSANHSCLSDCSSAFSRRKLEYFRTELEKLKPGDVVQVLVHLGPPRWEYQIYANDEPPALQPIEMGETSVPTILLVCASAVFLALCKRTLAEKCEPVASAMFQPSDVTSKRRAKDRLRLRENSRTSGNLLLLDWHHHFRVQYRDAADDFRFLRVDLNWRP
jgi:hypothetical protein